MEIFRHAGEWVTGGLFTLVDLSGWLLSPIGWIVLIGVIVMAALVPGKKILDLFFWGAVVAAFVTCGFFWHQWGYFALGFFAIPTIYAFTDKPKIEKTKGSVICRLGGFEWDRNDFCRGWLITGNTGTGKTQSGINNLLHQCFQNETDPPWGGLCIDEKGLYYEILLEMAKSYGRENDLMLLQTRPEGASEDWTPPAVFNLLSNDRIPSGTYAEVICDTAATLAGGEGDKGFFKTQAHSQISKGIDLLRCLGRSPTITDILAITQNKAQLKEVLETLRVEVIENRETDSLLKQEAQLLYNHFAGEGFLKQPGDQLGGVMGTIYNYLNYFSPRDVAEVFCNANQTFSIDEIDKGKIVCVAMPQKYSKERQYVQTILKMMFYQHVRQRFDDPATLKRGNPNVLILWQDEAQRFINKSDGDVDVIREALGTTVMATQGQPSLFPPLGGKEKAQVTLLNLRNRIIMQSANLECAEMSSNFIGKKEDWKMSYSSQGGGRGTTVSKSKEERFIIKPHELMSTDFLPKFNAVLCHASKGWVKTILPPIAPSGRLPKWYSGEKPPWFKEWKPGGK